MQIYEILDMDSCTKLYVPEVPMDKVQVNEFLYKLCESEVLLTISTIAIWILDEFVVCLYKFY